MAEIGTATMTTNDDPDEHEEGREDPNDSIVGSEFYLDTDSVATPATNVQAEAEAHKAIAPNEARRVSSGRLLLFVILVLSTSAVSAGIQWYTRQAEEDEFHAVFDILAYQIGNGWRNHIALQLGALDSLAISITSYYTSSSILLQHDSNSSITSWPLVTVADFDKQGHRFRRNTGAQSIILLPLVDSTQMRKQWESFTLEKTSREWIAQGFEYEMDRTETSIKDGDRRHRALLNSSPTIVDGVSSTIYSFDGNSTSAGQDTSQPPYLPGWQSSPVREDLVNFNFASLESIGSVLQSVLISNQSVLPRLIGNNQGNESLFGGTTPSHSLLYPLYDSFGSDQRLVGMLLSQSQWETSLTTNLPTSDDVIDVVFENSCGQAESYRIAHGTVDYLGVGVKSTHYNQDWEQSFDLSELGGTGGQELLLDMDDMPCAYTLRVYPSVDMEHMYITNAPWIFASTVVMMAVILLVAFMIYATLVDRHQRVVLDAAVKARTIVSSLFPSVVHDRLFDMPDTNKTSDVSIHTPPSGKQELQEQRRSQPPSEVSFASEKDDVENKPASGILSVASDSGGSGAKNVPNDYPDTPRSLRARMELPKQQIRNFLNEDGASGRLNDASAHSMDLAEFKKSKPIADLFPSVTVLFADISGFTAWSSAREPAQVFMLLETIYRSFDRTARKRSVFKIETIGDCYMAVTGLPDPQPDHPVIMVKFAKECMQKMNELTRKLEVSLGPDTASLAIRCGLHSGPVTAGVLRGEKSRFQLFGDTVNTASRMESTGKPNNIQVSQATADMLVAAGKGDWIQPRDDIVNAKGKGEIQTFWVTRTLRSGSMGSGRISMVGAEESPRDRLDSYEQSDSFVNLLTKKKSSGRGMAAPPLSGGGSRRSLLSSTHSRIWGKDNNFEDGFEDDVSFNGDDTNRQERLIDWNVDILTGLLKQIVAQRKANKQEASLSDDLGTSFHTQGTVLDEITEIIDLPQFAPEIMEENEIDPESIELDDDVEEQLRDFVTMIACMYRDNFFHNWEHASHVTMSAQKLLKRVLIADHERDDSDKMEEPKANLIDYTYGITSDPLTQFAVIFSAMIHDIDHTGVPNMQLVKEKAHVAVVYKNRSVAEQNSFDLAWDMLMDPNYSDLRRAIFANSAELSYFRQLVVNVVLATDIFDPNMKEIRNSRFEKAFNKEKLESPLSLEDERNLKTTIVIEYIMQASDVSHTMQHWHIYQSWNERLFEECYSAWKVGRAEKDPSLGWYKGELWFFDNYIIPLAQKLKDCGAFGAASDECLNYALENRKEWAARGEEIVAKFVANHAK